MPTLRIIRGLADVYYSKNRESSSKDTGQHHAANENVQVPVDNGNRRNISDQAHPSHILREQEEYIRSSTPFPYT